MADHQQALGGRGIDTRRRSAPATPTGRFPPRIVASKGRRAEVGERHDGTVSTRTLVVLAAACAVAILAASAIQILLAR